MNTTPLPVNTRPYFRRGMDTKMNINLCETCVHWRECDRGKVSCDLGYLDAALCGGHREERDSEHMIVARAVDTLSAEAKKDAQ